MTTDTDSSGAYPPGTARRSLTRNYLTALSAIALLSISGQVVIQTSLTTQALDSRTINVAGRQRMLSQRLTKAALAMVVTTDESLRSRSRRELLENLPLWTRSHGALQNGDMELQPASSAELGRLFADLEPHFESMRAGLDILANTSTLDRPPLSGEIEDGLESVVSTEARYLRGMDAIVDQYEREAKARVSVIQRLEAAMAAATLLILLLEGLFIFRPAVTRIGWTLARLKSAEQRLAERNERLVSVNQELEEALQKVLDGIVPICAVCKDIRDEEGQWTRPEQYISRRTRAAFSHGYCPDCMEKLYPEYC